MSPLVFSLYLTVKANSGQATHTQQGVFIMGTKLLSRNAKSERKQRTKRAPKRHNSMVVEYSSFYLVFTCIVNPSNNDKTGQMIQTYMIDKERLTEKDVFGAKCVECPLAEVCYVERDKLSVRAALKRLINGENTSYVWATLPEVLRAIEGREVRFGTYGDPSALPLDDVASIVEAVSKWTGYTHFWREVNSLYSQFFMASVEDLQGELEALSAGWRPFRVLLDSDESPEVSDKAIECPHYTNGVQCIDCGLCAGTSINAKPVYVWQHGS